MIEGKPQKVAGLFMIIHEQKIFIPQANSANLLQNSSGESAERDLWTPSQPLTHGESMEATGKGTEQLWKARQATPSSCCRASRSPS